MNKDLESQIKFMLDQFKEMIKLSESSPFLSLGMFIEHHSKIREIINKFETD